MKFNGPREELLNYYVLATWAVSLYAVAFSAGVSKMGLRFQRSDLHLD